MKTTDNYGRQVGCHKCGNYELKGFSIHTPPFANAIDSVYYGYCELHEKEVLADLMMAEQSKDRINQAGSNS